MYIPRHLSLLLLLVNTAVLSAAPIQYNINFTQNIGAGPLPAGGFTFDSSTSTFSNFVVNWFGTVFDFTANANAGNVNVAGNGCGLASGSNGVFGLLSGSDTCSLSRQWTAASAPVPPAAPVSTQVSFDFFAQTFRATTPDTYSLHMETLLPGAPSGTVTAAGGFTISAVPEPASAQILAIGLGLALLTQYRRFRTQRASSAA